ncbi:MAG: glycogen synthase [Planctomycetia bacterium]
MRIGLIAAEAAPLAKTGGLGDVTAALARHLAAAGHDARLVLPAYGSLRGEGLRIAPTSYCRDGEVALGPRRLAFTLASVRLPPDGPEAFLVQCPALYGRPRIYAQDGDEHLRFAFLAVAALEGFQRMGFSPDIVHVHDWHAALAPALLATRYAWDRQRFGATRSVLTVHNMAYQGTFPLRLLPEVGLGGAEALVPGFLREQGVFSFLGLGLAHADALTAVSRTNALEIQRPEHGFGLDGLVRARAGRLVGIPNGIDEREWDPAQDGHLAARYDASDLRGKQACRAALCAEAGLVLPGGVPLAGLVARLSAQKGFDRVLAALPPLVAQGRLGLVVLGSGSEAIAARLQALAARFPGRVTFWQGFDEARAHRVEAGSDLFLMPSLFEPCGLNQMYSQRYGTPPVVHRTGGLADTVEPWDARTGRGTGFAFEHPTAAGLSWALEQALACWADREAWLRVQRAGMARDFSWRRQVQHYVQLYERLHAR